MKKGPIVANLLYAAALTGFTVYAALHTFVIEQVYQTDATGQNLDLFSSSDAGAETSVESESDSGLAWDSDSGESAADSRTSQEPAETSQADDSAGTTQTTAPEEGSVSDSDADYEDENIRITLSELYEYDTKIYVADVQLSSAQYLKTAFAQDSYGRNVTEKTSSIAASHGAILAINGDYYGAQESGYVIRNGIVYRDTAGSSDLLCVYADGTLKIVGASEQTAEELVADGVWQAFSFGPALIEDGTISVTQKDEVGKAMASNPRTALGMIGENHFVFVVADGRTSESAGLSLYELAEVLKSLGVTTAYNLDGGGSSTMYFQGSVLNNPTTNGNRIEEREVSDIVYIGE